MNENYILEIGICYYGYPRVAGGTQFPTVTITLSLERSPLIEENRNAVKRTGIKLTNSCLPNHNITLLLLNLELIIRHQGAQAKETCSNDPLPVVLDSESS